ncbi:uncharacterized protein [Ambystoma mexicanum]|uniref:uncharacterized protein n=1 Tax=Ambystoma mexicanum TaxID=8296 RepID=UPI0037E7F7C7
MEEHDNRLKKVLKRLEDVGLKVEQSKCKIGVDEVGYLGHTVNGKGYKPKKDAMEAIRESPDPKNKDELRSFLRLCEYYNRFVRNFASVTDPLRKLMKRDAKFVWDDDCDKAVKYIKSEICNSLELAGLSLVE